MFGLLPLSASSFFSVWLLAFWTWFVLDVSVWMKLGAGAHKFKDGVLSSLTAGYFKVYQNRGKREVRLSLSNDRGARGGGAVVGCAPR